MDLMTYPKVISEILRDYVQCYDNKREHLNDRMISRENLMGHIDSKKGRKPE